MTEASTKKKLQKKKLQKKKITKKKLQKKITKKKIIGKILAARNRSPDPPFIGRNSRVNTATNTTPSHTHNPRQVVRAREISLRQKRPATISLAHIAHSGPHRPRTYRPRFVSVRKQARRVSAKTGGLHSNLGLLQSETDAT